MVRDFRLCVLEGVGVGRVGEVLIGEDQYQNPYMSKPKIDSLSNCYG